jgi:hypothetical protein
MKEDGSPPAQVDSIISKPPRSKELRETLQRLGAPQKNSSRPAAARELVTA